MKNLVFSLFITSIGALSVSADTIAQWTFETSLPITAGPLTPEVGSGSASSNTGGTFSNPAGWATVESWSSNAWNAGDYFEFSTSSVGFTDITLSWQQTGSNTGPRDFSLQYSANGNPFTAFASYSNTNDMWNSSSAPAASVKSVDLSAVSALDNNSSISFRVVQVGTVSIAGGTVASTGTGRIDTFTISGTVIPEPSAYAAIFGGLALTAVVAGRRRRA